MAFEEDGTFDREMFEQHQLPEFLARYAGQEHITHCADKTITIHADGTFTVDERQDAPIEVIVEPVGIPERLQLEPVPTPILPQLIVHVPPWERKKGVQ